MSCPICGAKVKNPSNPRHIKSKTHQAALKRESGALKGTSVPKAVVRSTPALEERLSALEQSFQSLTHKVDFLADEIEQIQHKSAGLRELTPSPREDSSQLPQAFLRALASEVRRSGASSPWVPIETVYATLPAHLRNWQQLEKLIPALFDQGTITLGEGGGSKKILLRGKRYGLVRKK
ncbi:MAG: hypothetical protein ACE5OZ_22450 [Candidatus Heimdallarchaeota archaeon]